MKIILLKINKHPFLFIFMLKILFNSKKAERHPIEMFFVALFYSSISIIVGSWIFPEYASLIAVFFTVISCLYVTQGAIRREESKEQYFREKALLVEHKKPLFLFLWLFIGIVVSFAFFTSVLPMEKSTQLFSIQQSVLDGIRGSVTGNSIGSGEVFGIIFQNNLKVIFISLIISLIYGAGAIFILTWNASIMGYVIGSIISEHGIISVPVAFLKYFLHGLPEMFSYFMVILAGGIIYSAILKGDLSKEIKSTKILKDVFVLIGLAIVLMSFAAVLEVFVSPLI